MERSIVQTADGSHTLAVPRLNEHYHSTHGAIQESEYVYIRQGFKECEYLPKVRVLEMGLGTGLNALLTVLNANRNGQRIEYVALEKYPLQPDEIALLNYAAQLRDPDAKQVFEQLHNVAWDENHSLSSNVLFQKRQADLLTETLDGPFDLVYYDAFAPHAQPDLWTEQVFAKIANAMNPGAILVTYCAQGQMRRNMEAAGLSVEKIPGPPGKREMVRARKTTT